MTESQIIINELLSLLFGFFTLWTCLGVSVFAVVSIVEVFDPYRSFYDHKRMYGARLKWWEELAITLLLIFFWPVSLVTVYEVIKAVGRDARGRYSEHKQRQIDANSKPSDLVFQWDPKPIRISLAEELGEELPEDVQEEIEKYLKAQHKNVTGSVIVETVKIDWPDRPQVQFRVFNSGNVDIKTFDLLKPGKLKIPKS